jgi:CubicO group peptidase (beta-lactamase class C family)
LSKLGDKLKFVGHYSKLHQYRVYRYPFLSVGFTSMYNRRMTRLPKRTFRRAFPAVVLAVLAYTSSAQAPPDRLKQVVQPYVDAQMFMGSVLVAKNGKVIFSKSYGMADLEWSVPNSSTTRFNIASMTKQFTAASILLLEDRGKLKTDDLVKKYLPDAPLDRGSLSRAMESRARERLT